MIARKRVEAIVDRLFEEEMLAMDGIFASYGIDEDVVSQLVEEFEQIWKRFRARLEEAGEAQTERAGAQVEPYQAIGRFLLKLRKNNSNRSTDES